MIIRRSLSWDVASSEITSEAQYVGRRDFLKRAGIGAVAFAGSPLLAACGRPQEAGEATEGEATPVEQPNSYEDITGYNNFYVFGADKGDPKANSGGFQPMPWTVRVEGLCNKP